jgi:hypothetical protein
MKTACSVKFANAVQPQGGAMFRSLIVTLTLLGALTAAPGFAEETKTGAPPAAPAPVQNTEKQSAGCMPDGGCCGNGACAQAAAEEHPVQGEKPAGCPCNRMKKAAAAADKPS